MTTSAQFAPTRFRVWLARCGDGPQLGTTEDPSLGAVALEPAEEGTMSGPQAEAYVTTFNRVAALTPSRIRAVALPVMIRYEGEPRAGQPLGQKQGA